MIPQLLLEQILCGEKKAEDFYEKYGKEELDRALENLNKSNQEIFEKYPAEKMEAQILKKKFLRAQKRKTSARIVRFSGFAAAAVFALVLLSPMILNSANKTSSGLNIRIKGRELRPELRLYKKDGQSIISLKNESLAYEGDTLQIAYITGGKNYGYIFSIDGNGNVTHHFPERGQKAASLEKSSGEVPLDFSYTLDDAPEYECFVFISSEKPFQIEKLENNQQKIDLNYIRKGTFVPEDCSKVVFTLNKE